MTKSSIGWFSVAGWLLCACGGPADSTVSGTGGDGSSAGGTQSVGSGGGLAGGGFGSTGGASPGGGSAPTSEVRQAMATYFSGVGNPGGCGVPDRLIDSPNYVALDVEYTPSASGSYQMDQRPLTDPAIIGEFNNGLNCGRWLRVTVQEFCTGSNPGTDGSHFCDAQWVTDEFTGATLDLVVADSCQDTNGWCRDDRITSTCTRRRFHSSLGTGPRWATL